MSLPVANGKSWITSSLESPPISLQLPVNQVVRYTTALGDYATCGISSHYTPTLLPIATSSVSIKKTNDALITDWVINTTISPGLIDRILYGFKEQMELEMGQVQFYFSFTTSSHSREGLVINAHTGSPNLSLFPIEHFTALQIGDIWYNTSGSLKLIGETLPGVIYSSSLITVRSNDTIANAKFRVSNNEYDNNVIGFNAIYTDQGYVSENSALTSGSGFINHDWGGGVHLIDSSSVSIFGKNDFSVPSGSLFTKSNIFVGNSLFSTIRIVQNSLFINEDLHARNMILNDLNAMGSGSIISINDGLISTINYNTGSVLEMPAALNGDWYLFPSGNFLFIRADNSWYPLLSGSNNYQIIDGGVY